MFRVASHVIAITLAFSVLPVSQYASDSSNPNLNENWVLRSSSVEVVIGKTDGMINKLVSYDPAPLSVLPRGNAMKVYLKYPDQHSGLGTVYADRVISSRVDQDSVVQKNGKQGLTCKIAFSDLFVTKCAEAMVTYTLEDDLLRIRVEVEGKSDYLGVPEVGMGQGYDSRQWQRHCYADLYHTDEYDFKESPSDALAPKLFQFDESPEDSILEDWDDWLQMPMGYLERDDRYMLWGSLDLGRFLVLAPNHQKLMPSFLFRPKNGIAGKTFVFDTFIKFIPRGDHSFIDAFRWYIKNVYSTHPVSKGIVAMREDTEYRTVDPGNIGSICILVSPWGTLGREDDYWKFYEDITIKTRSVHQWFGDWQSWDGRLPTEGKWYASHSGDLQISAEELRAYVAERQARGLKFYPYMRQLFANGRMYEDKPPYLEWMKRDRNGQLMPYPCGSLTDYLRGWDPISDETARRFGIDKDKLSEVFSHGMMGYVYADFDNADFRKWYIARTKAMIEYYNFDGVSWDMAWFDIHRGIHHGILRVQYEIYTWLKENHPEKRVLANMAHGNPSQLYTDMVYYEGPDWSVKSRAIEAGLAYKSAINGPIEYSEMSKNLSELRKCLSMGLTWFTNFGIPDERTNLPILANLTDLIDFSARANSLPVITEFGAVDLQPAGRTLRASVWARGGDFLLAAYAFDGVEDGASMEVKIRVRGDALERNGAAVPEVLIIKVMGKDGHPRQSHDFNYRKVQAATSYLEISGTLLKDDLLIATQWLEK